MDRAFGCRITGFESQQALLREFGAFRNAQDLHEVDAVGISPQAESSRGSRGGFGKFLSRQERHDG